MSFSKESDSTVYGVDYNGKVWALGNSNPPAWTRLHNPTNVNIKRLVSFSHILWGIGSDHQIYVYVPKRDIGIRVREEIWENQRWNPIDGFGKHLLPTDRAPFSSESGTEPREKSDKLPSDAWKWECDWQIENTFENELIAEGWTYALDFPATYHPEKTFKSFVRRRKLFRYRKFVGTNRWNKIESLHQDHTQEPFIDVAVGGLNNLSTPETCCLWAVSILGEVYFRNNTTTSNPEGLHWKHIPIRKGLEACQVTVARNGTPFVVSWTGTFFYRIGLTPKNPQGSDWLESPGPPGGLLQISAGTNCLWAITRDKKCWVLKGNWPDIVQQREPMFEWIELPGQMKNIAVGMKDDIVLALSDEEFSCLFLRVGISEDQKYGQSWKPVLKDADWDSLSVVSTVSNDMMDGKADSMESLVSLRPDVPPSTSIGTNNVSDSSNSTIPNSFCWVDGACASCLRTGVETDLEVGPWREDILQDLQKLKLKRTNFSYPDALEPSSTSWSKSVRVKFLHLSRNKRWLDGHLEISNNNHLMFHENLEKTWLCSVGDVLSIFGTVAGVNTLTCRIRNSLEPGVAEYVTFKFMNEKDTEEWHESISELALRPLEDFSIADIWIVTRDAEIHRAGQIKILEGPVEAEVVTSEPNGDFQFHYPLVRGFMPDSSLLLDISIPKGAERFSINLKGNTEAVNAFHYNPRFSDACVIRNSYDNGEWGEEERDGVFPFREGMSYTMCIECTQTHIITTITQKKTKFIFSFKHRVSPKCICNLFVYGDINVSSARYDPKLGESYDLEFVTQQLPGHFYKVEAGSNGSAWAIGYDLKVWCFTGSSKQQKVDGTSLGVVTDEHTYYCYENQRWNPATGFSGNVMLPTDRHGWTDESGRIRMEKLDIRLPSNRWAWVADWAVDYDTPHGVNDDGWQFAVDFPASYHPNKRINDFVRRRRWKRVARLTVVGPWQLAEGMKLVDLSIRMNEDCEWEVLGLQENGDVVVRSGISPECPIGTAWDSLSSEKPLISISGWYGQRIWAVGKDGFSYIRYAHSFQLLDRPNDTPLKQVKVGSSSIWAIGTNNALYRRTEVQAIFPEGREWIRVCDGVLQVGVAPDGNVWALLKTNDTYRCTLAKRMGISQNNPGGLGWELIATGPWRHFSVAGSFSRNK
ncbi:tectonin beta-propeller repeat-containing protein isoform X2 [Folsomia candida]|nr:tectonin beta-propeller repeat-containing protein isoform X2 [Folsomia candida]